MLEIIKYEGPNDTLVWKHTAEDFNTQSQLIVHDSQEAIFFKDGQALDLFGGGRHALSSDNIPLIRHFASLPFGKKTPFHCEVYFINKVASMNIMWGTASPITMEDPIYRMFVKVRANGQMGVKVSDSRKLLLKLVGTIPEFTQATLQNYFRGLMMTKIKNRIADTMIRQNVSFLEVAARLDELSSMIKTEMASEFEEYGITLANFYVNDISVPDEDYARLKAVKEEAAIVRAQTDAEVYKTVRMGEAMAHSRNVQGYSYQDERSYDVMEGAANNQGGAGGMMGNMMGVGMGLGMGMPMGRAMGNLAQSYMPGADGQGGAPMPGAAPIGGAAPQGAQPQAAQQRMADEQICTQCGFRQPKGAKFCTECGSAFARACNNCGCKLPDNAKFCNECGAKVN